MRRFKKTSNHTSAGYFISSRVDGSIVDENNRVKLANKLNIPIKNFIFAKQNHGSRVRVIKKKINYAHPGQIQAQRGDAMVTNASGMCLAILIADCVPILLFDPKKKAVGVAHAGWKGSLKKIAQKTIKKMSLEYDSSPNNIFVEIGPSIGPCCYEINSKTADLFKKEFQIMIDKILIKKKNKKNILNLWELNKLQLIQIGLPRNNIVVSGICTQCNSSQYFSYRASGGSPDRFAAGIMLYN